jgi:hypothetical protein
MSPSVSTLLKLNGKAHLSFHKIIISCALNSYYAPQDKTMALIRLRKIPFLASLRSCRTSSTRMKSWLPRVEIIARVTSKDSGQSEWRSVVSEVFGVKESSSADESVIDDAVH